MKTLELFRFGPRNRWSVFVVMTALGLMVTTAVDAETVSYGGGSKHRLGAATELTNEHTSGVSKLNLLAGRDARNIRQLASLSIGDGSYICSPSGFGQRSSCYRN